MSDTRALCEVVSAALDHHGNGKAQDAFETLMGRLKDAEEDVVILNEALAEEHTKAEGAYARGLEVHAVEAQRAEADNAAMLSTMGSALQRMSAQDWYAAREEILEATEKPHPGAALLEELEGLRTENKRLRQERNYWEGRASLAASEVAQQIVREPIAIRVEGIPEPLRSIIERDAHNAALEEAAKVADGEPDWIVGKSIARRIRALKKTGQGE